MGNISFIRIFLLCLFGLGIDGLPAENEISRVKRDRFYIDQVAARVGCFVTRSYNVTGTVWLIDNSTQLYIENFSFDGEDNGVSFTFNIALKGNNKRSYERNRIPVKWFDSKTKETYSHSRVFDNEIVLVDLPKSITPLQAPKIKWLSAWCKGCKRSFGDLVFNSENPRANACPPSTIQSPFIERQFIS